jgi:hypothetical protein
LQFADWLLAALASHYPETKIHARLNAVEQR